MILLKSNTFDEGFNMAGTYQAIPFMVGLTGIDENMGIPVDIQKTIAWMVCPDNRNQIITIEPVEHCSDLIFLYCVMIHMA
jgi:hypothetical protein